MVAAKRIPMGTLISLILAAGVGLGSLGTGAIFYGDTRWQKQDQFLVDLIIHGEDVFVTAKQFERWEINQLRRDIQELEWEESGGTIEPKQQALLDFLRLQLQAMEDETYY